jgi:hypothetical protein
VPGVNSVREPDAVTPLVRFDEKGSKTCAIRWVARACKPSTEMDKAELPCSSDRAARRSLTLLQTECRRLPRIAGIRVFQGLQRVIRIGGRGFNSRRARQICWVATCLNVASCAGMRSISFPRAGLGRQHAAPVIGTIRGPLFTSFPRFRQRPSTFVEQSAVSQWRPRRRHLRTGPLRGRDGRMLFDV